VQVAVPQVQLTEFQAVPKTFAQVVTGAVHVLEDEVQVSLAAHTALPQVHAAVFAVVPLSFVQTAAAFEQAVPVHTSPDTHVFVPQVQSAENTTSPLVFEQAAAGVAGAVHVFEDEVQVSLAAHTALPQVHAAVFAVVPWSFVQTAGAALQVSVLESQTTSGVVQVLVPHRHPEVLVVDVPSVFEHAAAAA